MGVEEIRVWQKSCILGVGELRGCALITYQNLSMLGMTLEFQDMIISRNNYSSALREVPEIPHQVFPISENKISWLQLKHWRITIRRSPI